MSSILQLTRGSSAVVRRKIIIMQVPPVRASTFQFLVHCAVRCCTTRTPQSTFAYRLSTGDNVCAVSDVRVRDNVIYTLLITDSELFKILVYNSFLMLNVFLYYLRLVSGSLCICIGTSMHIQQQLVARLLAPRKCDRPADFGEIMSRNTRRWLLQLQILLALLALASFVFYQQVGLTGSNVLAPGHQQVHLSNFVCTCISTVIKVYNFSCLVVAKKSYELNRLFIYQRRKIITTHLTLQR